MSTQSCSNSKAARPMNAHQIGKHNLQISCKNCSQRCAYLTGDSFHVKQLSKTCRTATPASLKCTAGCPCFISFRHFYRFADSTRKRHTHSGCATLPQTHCVSWICRICTASEKVLNSPMQSCTSTCITNAVELLSRVILVQIASLHAGHAYSSSV